MNGQMTSDLAWSVIIAALISALAELLMGLIIARRSAPGGKAFAALCFGLAVSSMGYIAELLRMSIQAPQLYRPQAVALLAAVVAPWIANMLFIAHALPGPRIDFTPFTFIITGPAIAWALFRRRLLDLVPVARDTLIERMT